MIESKDDILTAWENAKANNITQAQLVKILGISTTNLSTRIHRAKSKIHKYEPDLFKIDYGSPWKLTGDCIIIGDVHVPTVDYDFAQLPGMIAKKHLRKPRILIIAGDFFNMDVFSSYAKISQSPTFSTEIKAGKQLINEWLEIFDEIWILMGNHDRRLIKWTEGNLDGDHILSLVSNNPRVKWSNFGWCNLATERGSYRITHSKNYSVNQLTVADTLAQKYQQHIISHHEHHLAKGWDRFKRYLIVNNGGLFAPEKLAYVHLDDSKSPNMTKGFTMIKSGYPYVFGEEPFTDWKKWL